MRQIVLLRGVNLGARNRISMPKLSEAFASAGYEMVRTYLHSGNLVVSSEASPERLALDCQRRIAEVFGLDIAVIVRTRDELAEIVTLNPLGEVADNPKPYQVSFLSTAARGPSTPT